jgi:hypothetical protein
MSRSYTSSFPCASIDVLWDYFTIFRGIIVGLLWFRLFVAGTEVKTSNSISQTVEPGYLIADLNKRVLTTSTHSFSFKANEFRR